MKKVWLIFDSRAHVLDTDDCAVYEAFSEDGGDTLKSVKKERNKTWRDGVIFEYDAIKGVLENKRKIG